MTYSEAKRKKIIYFESELIPFFNSTLVELEGSENVEDIKWIIKTLKDELTNIQKRLVKITEQIQESDVEDE